MDDQAAPAGSASVCRNGYVHGPGPALQQFPKFRRASVTQRCAGAARKYTGHPPPLVAKSRVPDRVHTLVDSMQPTGGQASRDPRVAEPAGKKLRGCDDTVLPGRDPVDRGEFLSHTERKSPGPRCAPVAGGWEIPPMQLILQTLMKR